MNTINKWIRPLRFNSIFLCAYFTISLFVGRLSHAQAFMDDVVMAEYQYQQTGDEQFLKEKARIYKSHQEFDKSLKTLERIAYPDSSVNYEKILLNYLLGDYQKAQRQLLLNYSDLDILSPELVLLEILLKIELLDYDGARQLLHTHYQLLGIQQEDIDFILPKGFKPKNPEKARNISYYLPGIGQWYAGYFWKGLFSGAVQTGSLAFSLWSFLNGYYISGSMSGVAIFYSFYLGGARHAYNLATQTNQRRNKEISQKLTKILNEKSPE